ncbi:MAG: replication protein [Circoviridae sp.]|nr:MAG: replication protein [Circoviridae sp.]
MSRNFCTAIFDLEDLTTMIANKNHFEYLIIGKEKCPETERIHYQTYGELWKQTRWETLFKLYPKTSFKNKKGKLQSRKGSPQQAADYCKKDGDIYHEHGTLPVDRRGKKRKLEPYCEEIELRDWQKEIIELIAEPPNRKILWYWSEAGDVGKTTFAKYLSKHHSAIALNGKAADQRNGLLDWINQNEKWCDVPVICNIPRTFKMEYLSYEAIENIKDQYFYSGKYEGGQVCGPPIHYIIFSNFPPDFTRMSSDRYHVRQIDLLQNKVDVI